MVWSTARFLPESSCPTHRKLSRPRAMILRAPSEMLCRVPGYAAYGYEHDVRRVIPASG